MRIVLVCSLLVPAVFSSCAMTKSHAECRAVLERQAAAWNRGDLDGFCDDYWKSEHLVFATAEGTTVGWQPMRDRYRRRYSGKDKMGRLTFDELVCDALAEDTVVCRGRWRLARKSDAPSGRFVLVLRRFDDGWKIVSDYTTSD